MAKTTEEMIEVMQAYLDGKQIETRRHGKWHLLSKPDWNWINWDYRIKPEPIEFWVNVYPGEKNCHSLYTTKEEADNRARTSRIECIHVREVIE